MKMLSCSSSSSSSSFSSAPSYFGSLVVMNIGRFFWQWVITMSVVVNNGNLMMVVGQGGTVLIGGSTLVGTNEYSSASCNFLFDHCDGQFNNICDDPNLNATSVSTDMDCIGGDCADCDPCKRYDFDCSGCFNSNLDCYWCPGNAKCSSVRLDQTFYNLRFGLNNQHVACVAKDDWMEAPSAVSTSTTTTGLLVANPRSNSMDQCTAVGNVFNDPLYSAQQWSYQSMNVEQVWEQGITGAGVHIRINDMGVDPFNPDISGTVPNTNIPKLDISNSCPIYYPLTDALDHGTWSALIAAGNANNGVCSVGIAPDAILSACNVFSADDMEGMAQNFDEAKTPIDTDTTIEALGADYVIQNVHISSNSWGFPTCQSLYSIRRKLQQQSPRCPFRSSVEGPYMTPCDICAPDEFSSTASLSNNCQNAIIAYCANPITYEHDVDACADYLDLYVDCRYNEVQQSALSALSRGILRGRNGLGIIYLVASGNEHSAGADTNYEGWVNTRFTIAVGSVGKLGKHASYSTSGAALFVTGPGGDVDFLTNNVGCTHIGMGTSFSCPAVSGVVALMLQANPNLSWRDVQGILALTSTQTDPTHSSWTVNSAGYHHSYLYGFGIPNALWAVGAARIWTPYAPERTILLDSGTIDAPIVDDSSITMTTSLTVTNGGGNQNFIIETIYIFLDIHHASRGDLDITLTSPSGIQSVMHPGKRPENQVMSTDWKLMTLRNWGENPVGDWSLTIVDQRLGDLYDGCIDFSFVAEITNANLTCDLTEANSFCVNGQVREPMLMEFPSQEGMTAIEACCVCGGGQLASELQNERLKSWRLLFYGRSGTPDTLNPSLDAFWSVTGSVDNNNNNNVFNNNNNINQPTVSPTKISLPSRPPTTIIATKPTVIIETTPEAKPETAPTPTNTVSSPKAPTNRPTFPPNFAGTNIPAPSIQPVLPSPTLPPATEIPTINDEEPARQPFLDRLTGKSSAVTISLVGFDSTTATIENLLSTTTTLLTISSTIIAVLLL